MDMFIYFSFILNCCTLKLSTCHIFSDSLISATFALNKSNASYNFVRLENFYYTYSWISSQTTELRWDLEYIFLKRSGNQLGLEIIELENSD